MKRVAGLVSLSRDHHRALVLARALRRAGPPDVAAVLAELEPHFAIEEIELVPRANSHGGELAKLAARVIADHVALRTSADPVTLGDLLEAHVRFEERDFFPALERELGELRMSRLPAGLVEYKRTAEFDEATLPEGLKKSHTLRAGTWGEIVVTSGNVRYVLEDDGDFTLTLRPGLIGVIAPERSHHVELVPGDAPPRMYVRFLRAET